MKSSSPLFLEDAPASLEDELPMISQCQNVVLALERRKYRGWTVCACEVCGSGRVAFECPHSLPLHPSRIDGVVFVGAPEY